MNILVNNLVDLWNSTWIVVLLLDVLDLFMDGQGDQRSWARRCWSRVDPLSCVWTLCGWTYLDGPVGMSLVFPCVRGSSQLGGGGCKGAFRSLTVLSGSLLFLAEMRDFPSLSLGSSGPSRLTLSVFLVAGSYSADLVLTWG